MNEKYYNYRKRSIIITGKRSITITGKRSVTGWSKCLSEELTL